MFLIINGEMAIMTDDSWFLNHYLEWYTNSQSQELMQNVVSMSNTEAVTQRFSLPLHFEVQFIMQLSIGCDSLCPTYLLLIHTYASCCVLLINNIYTIFSLHNFFIIMNIKY
jgi:hypothetical protein